MFSIFLLNLIYIAYLINVFFIALLVVLLIKYKAINLFIKHLKLLLVLAKRLCLKYLTVFTNKAKKCYYSPFITSLHRFLLFSQLCVFVVLVKYQLQLSLLSSCQYILLKFVCNIICYGFGIPCHVVTCTSAASIGGVERQNSVFIYEPNLVNNFFLLQL